MALTGKTIGQLTYLSEINNNTLIPVEASGDTYHVFYSAFTSSNYTELTYDELYTLYTGLSLVPGKFYLITDFQTCYDQPNYNSTGGSITTGNFKSGSTEPLVVLAISNGSLSPQAFSPSNPNDLIKYNIAFNFTEVTNTPAKGRITERIDRFNNRTDYDFRAVQFIRYRAFFCEQYLRSSTFYNRYTIQKNRLITFVFNFNTNNLQQFSANRTVNIALRNFFFTGSKKSSSN